MLHLDYTGVSLVIVI